MGIVSCASTSDDAQTPPCELGASQGEATPTNATSFVPFAQHFAGFHGWPSTHATTSTGAPRDIHGDADMTVYYNRPPGHGLGEFPIGTVIVKETTSGPLDARTTFAMVKRGGGYNAKGSGWEWFELKPVCGTDAPTIEWRGVGPPSGHKYGGNPDGCNSCHSIAADNDFVLTDGLRLRQF